MKIQGRLDLVQSNLDFYCRLTSTSLYRSVEDLRKFFYSRFLDDAKRNLKSIVSSKEKVVEEVSDTGNSNASAFLKAVKEQRDIVEDTGSNASAFLKAVREDKNDESVKGTILDDIDYDSASEDTFLSAVKSMGATEGVSPVKGICLDDIVAGIGVQKKEDVHGVYLEDTPSASEPTEVYEEGIEEDIPLGEVHGTYLEDVKIDVESVETTTQSAVVKEDVHGVFLEDVKAEEQTISDVVYEPEFEEVRQEVEPYNMITEGSEVIKKPNAEIEIKPINDNIIPINEKVVVEVSVPPTVREFLKKHPGSEISEVEKYYPRKTVMKELKMGKIYKKGSKLFI